MFFRSVLNQFAIQSSEVGLVADMLAGPALMAGRLAARRMIAAERGETWLLVLKCMADRNLGFGLTNDEC